MNKQSLKDQFTSIFREKRLFFLSLFLCALTEYLYLTISGWVPFLRGVICGLPLFAFLIILLIALFISSIIYLVKKTIEEGITLKAFLPLIVLIATIWLIRLLPILPSRQEMIFYRHYEEFKELTELAVTQCREGHKFDFPSRDFYEYVVLYEYDGSLYAGDINDGGLAYTDTHKIAIEYIVDDFRHPLVFVTSDKPNEVYDTCSHGGGVIKKIEPNWYICERDWN